MKTIVYVLLTFFLLSCTEEKKQFTNDVLNRYTPVKNQKKSQLCWAYAMLSAIETEHIMRGDSVHLSVAWVEKMIEKDSLAPKSKRGTGMTLINLIQRYGLVPYDAMKDKEDIPPKFVFMNGATYTPLEFAHSVCAPDEYIGLMSDSKWPYGQMAVPEWKDNWERNELLNLPVDSLLNIAERAVCTGHGVCWEGDISERGFKWKNGYAVTSFLSGRTTDDHCMAIVGLAHDDEGKRYFIMKNSWGTKNPYGGLMYLSYGYFMKKTVAVFLSKDLVR